MAYDEGLVTRVREVLGDRPGLVEKQMFGGLAFMVHGNVACGVRGDNLIVRVAADDAETALDEPGTRPFDLTGRPMKGWLAAGGRRRARRGRGPAPLGRPGPGLRRLVAAQVAAPATTLWGSAVHGLLAKGLSL
jgi:hypothetical protein